MAEDMNLGWHRAGIRKRLVLLYMVQSTAFPVEHTHAIRKYQVYQQRRAGTVYWRYFSKDMPFLAVPYQHEPPSLADLLPLLTDKVTDKRHCPFRVAATNANNVYGTWMHSKEPKYFSSECIIEARAVYDHFSSNSPNNFANLYEVVWAKLSARNAVKHRHSHPAAKERVETFLEQGPLGSDTVTKVKEEAPKSDPPGNRGDQTGAASSSGSSNKIKSAMKRGPSPGKSVTILPAEDSQKDAKEEEHEEAQSEEEQGDAAHEEAEEVDEADPNEEKSTGDTSKKPAEAPPTETKEEPEEDKAESAGPAEEKDRSEEKKEEKKHGEQEGAEEDSKNPNAEVDLEDSTEEPEDSKDGGKADSMDVSEPPGNREGSAQPNARTRVSSRDRAPASRPKGGSL